MYDLKGVLDNFHARKTSESHQELMETKDREAKFKTAWACLYPNINEAIQAFDEYLQHQGYRPLQKFPHTEGADIAVQGTHLSASIEIRLDKSLSSVTIGTQKKSTLITLSTLQVENGQIVFKVSKEDMLKCLAEWYMQAFPAP